MDTPQGERESDEYAIIHQPSDTTLTILDMDAAESETGQIIYQICDALAVRASACGVGDDQG